jgi:hypothetical protein
MTAPRYTTTPNLTGCTVMIDDRMHGLFIAKRAQPRGDLTVEAPQRMSLTGGPALTGQQGPRPLR